MSNTYNILRRLGFKPCHMGTKFIIHAINIIRNNDNILFINDVYVEIAKNFNISDSSKVRLAISYAISHRNEDKSIQNFQSIFGYEYDYEIFCNKDFIEELSRIINH